MTWTDPPRKAPALRQAKHLRTASRGASWSCAAFGDRTREGSDDLAVPIRRERGLPTDKGPVRDRPRSGLRPAQHRRHRLALEEGNLKVGSRWSSARLGC